MGYSIWLEFEAYEGNDATDREEEYCNMAVTYDDGRHQGYNVWTLSYFRDNIHNILDKAEQAGFAVMPDLIVTRLDREHITEVLKQIIPQ